jgi:hypothetical protein
MECIGIMNKFVLHLTMKEFRQELYRPCCKTELATVKQKSII